MIYHRERRDEFLSEFQDLRRKTHGVEEEVVPALLMYSPVVAGF
jgi:hypothetical protein